MPTVPWQLILFALLVVGVLSVLVAGPLLSRRKEHQALRILNQMHRYARRHNTFVRNHDGLRYVVVLGTRGFHYMMDGQMVARNRLLKAIGEDNERILLRVEGEESRQGPTPTRLTVPA